MLHRALVIACLFVYGCGNPTHPAVLDVASTPAPPTATDQPPKCARVDLRLNGVDRALGKLTIIPAPATFTGRRAEFLPGYEYIQGDKPGEYFIARLELPGMTTRERIAHVLAVHPYGGAHYLYEPAEEVLKVYAEILNDDASDDHLKNHAMCFVSEIKHDRKPFIEIAVRELSSLNSSLRHQSVVLLMQIGSEPDTLPIVPLLSDTDSMVRQRAGECLVAIGGRRTVAAMDVWMRVNAANDDIHHRQFVLRCRDELNGKLDKQTKKPE